MATKKEITKHEETAIVPTAALREITPATWAMLKEIAQVVYRKYGMVRWEDAAAIMGKGYEVGFGLFASFELVECVNGKPPSVNPKGAMALLHNSPAIKKVEINRLTDKSGNYIGHECTITRTNGFTATKHFTVEMARKAGLVKPDSAWAKYEEQMCQWRAIGFCADIAATDITAGGTTLMNAPEAYGVALTEGGDIIDVPAQPVSTDALQELVTQYGAQAVMDANGGAIPTNGQIAEVRAKLEGAKQHP